MLGRKTTNGKKLKIANDENPMKPSAAVPGVKANVQHATSGSTMRSALGDLSNNVRKGLAGRGGKEKAGAEKPTVAAHRRTVSTIPTIASRAASRLSVSTRPPVRPTANPPRSVSAASSRPITTRQPKVEEPPINNANRSDGMDVEDQQVEDVIEVDFEGKPMVSTTSQDVQLHEIIEMEKPREDNEELLMFEDAIDEDDWTIASPMSNAKFAAAVAAIKATFKDDIDETDMTMVSEYADEIFAYMGKLELETMANPCYMDAQTEIEWSMRKTLVDWLLQVHLRYHMLPETLWIAINIVDRFLSRRVVSLVKLQLVGVTAMFIASKYEEIMAPSVEEFAFMTENGYTRDEILKGEKIILQSLDFNVSTYCSPYSWVRKISKADDYDIQTRTLCKFLMEVTLLDHRFLRAKPSLIAAVGMYTSKRMLQGQWDDAFVYYSDYTEEQLIPGFYLLLDNLAEAGFETGFVSKKYANKKFLKASIFARDWALNFLSSQEYLQSP